MSFRQNDDERNETLTADPKSDLIASDESSRRTKGTDRGMDLRTHVSPLCENHPPFPGSRETTKSRQSATPRLGPGTGTTDHGPDEVHCQVRPNEDRSKAKVRHGSRSSLGTGRSESDYVSGVHES